MINTVLMKLISLSGDSAGGSTGGAAAGDSWLQSLPMLLIMAAVLIGLYFLTIRPEKKRAKEAEQMRNTLGPGDEITTTGGIVGRILSVTDETVLIETSAERTKIRVMKSSIARVDYKVGAEITEKDKNN